MTSKKSFKSQIMPLASTKISALILVALAFLTLVGTLYQANHGLWQSQQKFFHAWIAWIPISQNLEIPFPGVMSLGALAIINLLAALFLRIKWKVRNLGLIILHGGLLLLLLSGAASWKFSTESHIQIGPNQSTQVSFSSQQWEVSRLIPDSNGVDVLAMDFAPLKQNDTLNFGKDFRTCTVTHIWQNATVLATGSIMELPSKGKDPDQLRPALSMKCPAPYPKEIILSAGLSPITLRDGSRLVLQARSYPLPIELHLLQFKRTLYKGTNVARSYESHVEIRETGKSPRQITISMNQPFRIGSFTFYQSSFTQNSNTGMVEQTILSVVHNPLRTLPYFATLLLGIGLCLHFVLYGTLKSKNNKTPTSTQNTESAS